MMQQLHVLLNNNKRIRKDVIWKGLNINYSMSMNILEHISSIHIINDATLSSKIIQKISTSYI